MSGSLSRFCVLPFCHLYVHPTGLAKPCCRFDVGTLKQVYTIHSAEEILTVFYSAEWVEIRKAICEGKILPGCHKCYSEDRAGESYRSEVNRRAGLTGGELPSGSPTIDYHAGGEPRITYLEFAPGNMCNLGCRYCETSLSSSWSDHNYVESEKRNGESTPIKRALPSVLQMGRLPNNLVSSLTSVKISGGEPFLHRSFLDFLSGLDSSGRLGDVSLRIITNSSFIPREEYIT